ncbi:uncharacterized protein LOC112694352 [Sipha flava]|uniref:Cell division cycle-associated 7-like protein n=1 Tax=Sipha flava TaxID=143950 RepID=A0A2S2Q3N2_9HEMI|nr:uncharacterized protein LOC112694352 [Sipha flava]
MSVHDRYRRVYIDDELSAYERARLKNIKDIYEQFGELFENVQKSAEVLQTATKSTSAPVKSEVKTNGRVHNRNWQRFKLGSKPKLLLNDSVRQSSRLGCKRKPIKYNDLSDNDDEPKKKKRTSSKKICKGRKILLVSDVTQEMLNNIAYKTSGKILSDNGTTCHQCRQKTLDQKSCCRNKLCVGVRGMFCGFCLGNRYGEDVADVLQNPNWTCPVCRNDCNCSICRRKRGQGPTGPMVQLATAYGYKSVKHYLYEKENKFSENLVSENVNLNDFNPVEQGFTDDIKSGNQIPYEQLDKLINNDFVEVKIKQDSPEMILNRLYQELYSKEDDFEEFELH